MIKKVPCYKEGIYRGVSFSEDGFLERLDDVFSGGVFMTQMDVGGDYVSHNFSLWFTPSVYVVEKVLVVVGRRIL